MWQISLTMTLISLLLAPVKTEYTLTSDSSEMMGPYHYPAPPKYKQLYDRHSHSQSQPQQHEQQSVYVSPKVYHNQYQGNYYSSPLVQHSAHVARQFALPALDNVTFTLALSNQGYTFGNTPKFNAALKASPRLSKTSFKPRSSSSSSSSSSPSSPSSSSSSSSSSTAPAIGSLNVKLPLPIGITPINIGPLPLQTGAPYAAIPKGVTSYGTIYPQRKRR